MKSRPGSYFLRLVLSVALLTTATIVAPPARGWQQQQQQGAAVAPKPASTLSSAEREASARVKLETIRSVTSTLAGREMEGRGTATPGGEKAARYLAEQFSKLGLKPLGDAGTYLQAVKFKSSHMMPESFIKAGDVSLKFGQDFIVSPPYTSASADATGELVFVGYGLTSPELKRDDLAGLDVKGKIVVVLNGRPKNADEAAWSKATANQAVGRNLIAQGAAGIILAYAGATERPYTVVADYLARRRVALADWQQPSVKLPPILIVGPEGAEKLFAGAGTTFAQAMQKAASGEFASLALKKPATVGTRVKLEEVTGSNVVGLLEGSDPKLKDQAVVYSAHYDAFGTDSSGRIYPGAADNALGVGMMMSIAEAFSKSTTSRPRRSIIFLAVTGEEYGLLGAQHWVEHPTWPIERIAADLNFDGIGTEVYGPVKRIVAFGAEYSDLGAVFEDVTAATGNIVTPDPFPEEKAFYRSDHYAFVLKGVPALMLLGAPGGDPTPFIARAQKWMATDYHQPTDTVRPDWNWDGPRTLAMVGMIIGMRVADANQMPAWLPAAPFKRAPGTS
ncbi:MAG: M28 family peptidase [Pyrinomonadaceae bacterium]